MKVTPIAAGGLLDGAGLLVGNGAASGNPAELVEQLTFVHRARGGIDRVVGIALLGVHGRRAGENERERKCADDETEARQVRRHACSSVLADVCVSTLLRLRRDRLAICRLPTPSAGAVAALDHALLVDLRDDLAVFCAMISPSPARSDLVEHISAHSGSLPSASLLAPYFSYSAAEPSASGPPAQ